MTTKRKEIRSAVKDLIVSGSTAAADRVFTGRVVPFYRATYPMASIYTPTEDLEFLGHNATERERKVRVAVQLIDGNADQDTENALDDLANQVESILDIDDNWGLTYVSRIDMVGTVTDFVFDEKADKHYVSQTINFDVYYIEEVEPETPADTESVELNGTEISSA